MRLAPATCARTSRWKRWALERLPGTCAAECSLETELQAWAVSLSQWTRRSVTALVWAVGTGLVACTA